jgi:hypothetical protein
VNVQVRIVVEYLSGAVKRAQLLETVSLRPGCGDTMRHPSRPRRSMLDCQPRTLHERGPHYEALTPLMLETIAIDLVLADLVMDDAFGCVDKARGFRAIPTSAL